MAKIKSNTKSKVKKPDSVINIKENNHEIMITKFLNEHALQVVYGNMFSLLKRDLEMFEEIKGSGPRIVPHILLEGLGDKQIIQSKKSKNEEYQVTGVEDHQVMKGNQQ